MTELDWHGSLSEKCNKLILNELQHQAVYAPVVYQLTLEGMYAICVTSIIVVSSYKS